MQLAVFAFSAFFHEYAVSVPLRVFKIYAFMGMIIQESLDLKCSLWLDFQFSRSKKISRDKNPEIHFVQPRCH